MPLIEVERVLRLYREHYTGFNVRHFHEIVRREHGVTISYSFVKQASSTFRPTPRKRGGGASGSTARFKIGW